MSAPIKFNSFRDGMVRGVFNLDTDQLNLMFTNTKPSADLDSDVSDITEITPGNGYAEGGIPISSSTIINTDAKTLVFLSEPLVTANGGSIGPYSFMVLYDSSVSNGLICYYPILDEKGNRKEITIPSGEQGGGNFVSNALAII